MFFASSLDIFCIFAGNHVSALTNGGNLETYFTTCTRSIYIYTHTHICRQYTHRLRSNRHPLLSHVAHLQTAPTLPFSPPSLLATSSTSSTLPSLAHSSNSARPTLHRALYVARSRLHPFSHHTFSPQHPTPTSSTASTLTTNPVVVATSCRLFRWASGSVTIITATAARYSRRRGLERRWCGIARCECAAARMVRHKREILRPPQ